MGDMDTDGWFATNVGTTETRVRADPLNVLSKNCNLDLRQNCFTVRVVRDWSTGPHYNNKKHFDSRKA
jgi:hypothetical protein